MKAFEACGICMQTQTITKHSSISSIHINAPVYAMQSPCSLGSSTFSALKANHLTETVSQKNMYLKIWGLLTKMSSTMTFLRASLVFLILSNLVRVAFTFLSFHLHTESTIKAVQGNYLLVPTCTNQV